MMIRERWLRCGPVRVWDAVCVRVSLCRRDRRRDMSYHIIDPKAINKTIIRIKLQVIETTS